jgi:oligopeptide transport system substrate-binding protein
MPMSLASVAPITLRVCAAAVLFGVLGLQPAQAETPVEAGYRTQTLHLGNLSEPNDLDPQIADSQQTFTIIMSLMEGLAQYDPKSNEPVPAVAERWEVSSDNLRWTFHLRKNSKWSNGDPVTAHDFVFAYQRMLSPAFGAEYAYMLHALKNGAEFNAGKITDASQIGARAVDDHTLELSLAHAVPYLPAMVCHAAWYPLHKPTIEKFGRIDQRGTLWTRPGNYVGNGYMVLADWKPNQFIRVTKSPTYWDRDAIKLNEVFIYPIENEDAEERAFRSGQLHITSTLPISKIAVYKKERPDVFDPRIFLATYFYRFNVTKPPLNDARVRRALSMAIDRERLVKFVTRGEQPPAGNLTPPNTAGFTSTAGIRTDIAAAKKLLAEAGFPNGRDFPRFDIYFNTNQGHRQIAEAIQQMWKRNLGIDVGLYNQEAKVYVDAMRNGDYAIARFGWVGDYLDPSTFLDIMTSDSGNNQTGWKNEEYDRLIAAAKTTADREKRYEYYQRCEQILAEEAPIAPIYFYTRNNLRLPSVKGWYGNLLDLHPLKGVYLEP